MNTLSTKLHRGLEFVCECLCHCVNVHEAVCEHIFVCVCVCEWIMTGCGSTEGIDNSLGCGPRGIAGRHSAVLTLHSHITECLALSPALLHNPCPRTTTTPHPHLNSPMTSLPDLQFPFVSPSFAFLSLVIQCFSLIFTAMFLSNGAELTTVHCPVNLAYLSSGPLRCSTRAPQGLLALTYKSCSLHTH